MLFHNSAPWTPSVAEKKSTPLKTRKFVGSAGPLPESVMTLVRKPVELKVLLTTLAES